MKITSIRCAVAAVAAGVAVTLVAVPGAATAAAGPTNLIRNPGAEQAQPLTDGQKVPVKYWTVAKKYKFTAVGYGAPAFPTRHSPGPAKRGKNFFAGGSNGTTSVGRQTDSLSPYASWIKAGKAHFRLTGWLGGYASQGDNATLTVTWETNSGKALGHSTIGPVTEPQRGATTGMRYRSTDGTVPRSATKARVTLRMVRTAGTYNDGYADNLRLLISKA